MSDSAGCRILVVSPSAARAHQFVQRVQALSAALARTGSFGDGKGKETEADSETHAGQAGQEQTSVSTSRDPLAAGSSTSIPWTIANRYYTAEVHFETHDVDRFRALHAVGVPAVIYVWGASEPYREHIPAIANKIRAYDPEVALAVRFGVGDAADPPPGTNEDEDGLDEFLSEHGFEFVEGERAWRRPTQDEDRHSDDEDSGIPGLPRVIDALSTIMWPSLVQSAATRQRKSRARDLIGWALEEEADDGLRALIPDVPRDPLGAVPDADKAAEADAAKRKSRMQREMEELERWLEDEEAGAGRKFGRDEKAKAQEDEHEEQQQKYEAAADADARTWVVSAPMSAADGWEDMLAPPSAAHTPRDAAFPDIHLPSPSPRTGSDDDSDADTEHGFDDDFADFVSAGPHMPPPAHGGDRLLEVRYDVGRLTPMHTGASYRSLGSVSDLGEGNDSMSATSGAYGALGDDEDDEDDDALNEGGDPDLPSRAEILETSHRLFGAAAFAPALLASTSAPAARPAEPRPSTTTDADADADAAADLSLDTDDGEESSAVFDLSRVFSALQGMKDEIAGMDNEDERRRAAARVALGLVYGLGGTGTGGRAGSTPGVAAEEAGAT
ncbi:uncharacterized protein BXZ73DRAFT_101176 [Epithele typhae]|uniref:uncharacterized protein n=1 Tax=Epithele typhae TaxID=378194 RepID=UPI002007B7CB|nr:uncharacterized protein BXZ73DRAFT_101176 [Epithele typhae]KAH9933213.1 hypothetical protein BXZ73DRAFT_101176 [Epithele typhae]